jgi:hypothetical protein
VAESNIGQSAKSNQAQKQNKKKKQKLDSIYGV